MDYSYLEPENAGSHLFRAQKMNHSYLVSKNVGSQLFEGRKYVDTEQT